MKLGWLCAEKATAVSLGCAGLLLGDPGLLAGSAVAGAGLLGLWSRARCAEGVNSEKLLADARARLVKDFANWAEGRDLAEADVIAADKAMEQHLAECVPPVAELAKTTFHAEEFPGHAAHLVVERLAEKNPIFSATHPSRSPVAREFALLVMHSALAMAKEQPAFLQRLTQEITLLLPGYVVRIEDAVKAADAGSQARDAAMEALLRQIIANQQPAATAQGVSAEKLRMLALRIVGKVDDEAEAERALSAAIDELLKLRAEAERGTNFGDEVDEAIRRIFARVEANDLDGAGRQGAEEYHRLAEMMRGLQAAQASLAEANLSVARMAFDAEGMAHWAVERHRLAEGVAALSLDQLRSEMRDWYEAALRTGQRLETEVAIHLAERSVAAATTPTDRAKCENDLGNALWAQGQRSGGAAGLELLARAVAAYEAVLAVSTRAAMPGDWAMTQNNLGNSLQTQGGLSGGTAGLDLLARAVAAYEAALEVYTRAEMPAQWAATQNNLASALWAQGKRSGGAAGLELLARAVAAYEAVLEVRTRADSPAKWAMTKNNLGNALVTLGERSSGATGLDLLAQAVAAYEAALEVYTRAEIPADWAMTQNNLGGALAAQGYRSGGATGLHLLARAVEASASALDVYTRADMPADWAMTQFNIALAEEARGDWSEGAAQAYHWRVAEAAVLLALEVYDPVNMSYDHDKATEALTRIRAKLAGVD